MQQNESTKPLRQLMFSKVMNASVKHAVKTRLDVMLEEEERAFTSWKERCERLLLKTRAQQIERNYMKRLNALKIVCWMLSPNGDRGDLPPIVMKRQRAPLPKKEPKALLDAPPPPQPPVISQEDLSILLNLAALLKPKNV